LITFIVEVRNISFNEGFYAKPGNSTTTVVPAGAVATATNPPATIVNAGNYGTAVAYLKGRVCCTNW
jgi:hypothetical protein